MIVNAIFHTYVALVNLILSPLPEVKKLPSIGGYDIDTALTSGMALFYRFIEVVWPIQIVFIGFLILLSYYTITRILLRSLLGKRAPGTQ